MFTLCQYSDWLAGKKNQLIVYLTENLRKILKILLSLHWSDLIVLKYNTHIGG